MASLLVDSNEVMSALKGQGLFSLVMQDVCNLIVGISSFILPPYY